MAAAGFREAHRIRDDVDYGVSHRRPPPIPTVAYASTTAGHAPVLSDQPGRPHNHPNQVNLQCAQTPQTVIHRVPQEGAIVSDDAPEADKRPRSQSRRRGSLGGILRRNSGSNTTPASAPPLPQAVTRIAQAQNEAARARALSNESNPALRSPYQQPAPQQLQQQLQQQRQQQQPIAAFHSRKLSGEGKKGNMLRKSSKIKQQQAAQAEQERLARETAQHRQPPHLPSLDVLPNIASFGGEDARSDYQPHAAGNRYGSAASGSAPQHRAANFSRPGMASANFSAANSSSSPAYAVRGGSAYNSSSSPDVPGAAAAGNGEYVVGNPYDDRHSESMANRGRYSYASSTAPINSVNSPRRVRRRKDPTPFNILVVGAKNSGKTSFISFLKHSLSLKSQSEQPLAHEANGVKSSFTSAYLETDMDGERVGLTIWDSAGLERNIVDLQLREMTAFVEAKFEETFVEEQKVMRTPGVKDTHIHCVFLLLDPVRLDLGIAAGASVTRKTGLSLADEDLQVMRSLWGKTTVIPVISKADTLTVGHMAFLKRAVWQSLKGEKLDPLEALELEEDLDEVSEEYDSEDGGPPSEEDFVLGGMRRSKAHKRQSSLTANGLSSGSDEDTPYIPMSILSPDLYDLPPYANLSSSRKQGTKPGRRFPWGFADPNDPEHCDFGRLRDSIFSEWRSELRELSRTKWYENWRTSRLNNLPSLRQRVKGGVTPTAAVPREGRMVSNPAGNPATAGSRQVSQQQQQQQQQYQQQQYQQQQQYHQATSGAAPGAIGNAGNLPRSVSGATNGSGAVYSAPGVETGAVANPTPPVGMAVTTAVPADVAAEARAQRPHIPGAFNSVESYH